MIKKKKSISTISTLIVYIHLHADTILDDDTISVFSYISNRIAVVWRNEARFFLGEAGFREWPERLGASFI